MTEHEAWLAKKPLARSPAERESREREHPTLGQIQEYLRSQNKPYDDTALRELAIVASTKPEEGADNGTAPTENQPTMPDPPPQQPSTKVDIPAWMPEDPQLWFQLVEDCFRLQNSREGGGADMPDEDKIIRIGAKLPRDIIRLHKVHYVSRDYQAFKNGICGVATKTPAATYREFMGAKLKDGMTPSTYVRQLMVTLGNLADNSRCRTPRTPQKCNKGKCGGECGPGSFMAGQEHIVVNWLLKNSLETQLPTHMAAVLSSVPFSVDEYLDQADALYANDRAHTAAGTASVETCIAALSQVGADPAVIAAVKQAGKYKRRDNNNNRQRDNTQNRNNQSKRCTPHEKYGLKAWTCYGNGCPDKDKPLAPKPDKKKKSGDVAGVNDSGVTSE